MNTSADRLHFKISIFNFAVSKYKYGTVHYYTGANDANNFWFVKKLMSAATLMKEEVRSKEETLCWW